MAYVFRRSETLAEGLGRVVNEQLQGTLDALSSSSTSPAAAIHQARRHLKKLRAVLRLVPSENQSWLAAARHEVHDIAALLAQIRDLDSLQQSWRSLLQSSGDHFTTPQVEAVEAALQSQLQSRQLLPVQREKLLEQAHRRLDALAAEQTTWQISEVHPAELMRCLAKRYRQGQRAMHTAMQEICPEALHAWRNCSKDHAAQVRLLDKVWPGMIRARVQAVSTLGDLLGEDHDLSLLARTIQSSGRSPADQPLVDAVCRVIENRQQQLRRQSFRLGQLIYVEKKRRLRKRLSSYWKIWKSPPRPGKRV